MWIFIPAMATFNIIGQRTVQSFTRRKFFVRPIEKERKESPENKKGVYQDQMNSLSQMDISNKPLVKRGLFCAPSWAKFEPNYRRIKGNRRFKL